MDDAACVEVVERDQQVLAEHAYRLDGDAALAAKLLHGLAEVHLHWLKHERNVAAVRERVQKADAVLLVPRVLCRQLIQEPHLRLRRLAHDVVVADELDSHDVDRA